MNESPPDSGPRDWLLIIPASYLTAVGVLIPNTLPQIIGAIADDAGFAADQLGAFAALYSAGALVAYLSGPLWVRRFSYAKTASVVGALAISTLLVATQVAVYEALLALFFVFGVCLSALAVPGFEALGSSRDLPRAYAVAMLLQLGLAAFLAYAIGAYLQPRWGPGGIYTALAASVVPCIVCGIVLRERRHSTGQASRVERNVTWNAQRLLPFMLAFLAQFAFIAAIYVLWVFMERIGVAAGLSGTWIGFSFSVTQVFALVGVTVAAFGTRYVGRRIILVLGTCCLVGACYLADQTTPAKFFISVSALTISLSMLGPIYAAILREVDATHRLYVIGQASHSAGGIAGSAIAGAVAAISGFPPLLAISAAMGVAGAAILWASIRLAQQPGLRLPTAVELH